MNKITLIIFLLQHIFTTAQVVPPPPPPVQSTIMATNVEFNVLYRNWKNKIKIAKPCGYNPKNLKVSCSGCSITSAPDKDGNYTAVVGGSTKTALIKVYTIDDETGISVELSNDTFRIYNLPLPTAFFGGKAGGTMKKTEANMIPKLNVKLRYSPLDVTYSIVEFVLFSTKDGVPLRIKATGNKITNEMKKAIRSTPRGGNLIFGEIKVKSPGGKVFTLEGGIVFRLI